MHLLHLRHAVLLLAKTLGALTLPISNACGAWKRTRRSESWLPIPGKVRATQVTALDQQWGLYSASTYYGYSVNGENYPGSFKLHFAWKFQSDRHIARMASGAAITVRYNPSNPEESVFRMDDQYALSSGPVKNN